MKSKFYIFLFVPLFITFSVLTLPFFKYLKMEIKKEIKINILRHKFENEDLVQFSEDDLSAAQWLDSKEFMLKGNLYDIVKVETEAGRKIYYTLHDHKETSIKKYELKIASILNFSKDKSVYISKLFSKDSKVHYHCINDLFKFHFKSQNSSKYDGFPKIEVKKFSKFIFEIELPPKIC